MANISMTTPTYTGTQLTYTAANAGGDTVPLQSWLLINNASAGSITVTVASQVKCSQNATHNLSIAVPAGQVMTVGPLGSRFADPTTGLVDLTYSGVTSLTIAAIPAPVS